MTEIDSYRSEPTFKPRYSYTDPETGNVAEAPFPVAVSGVGDDEPFLGVGKVIGSIDLDASDHPVIEIDDIKDGKPYTILGCESFWTWPVPEEVLESISDGRLVANSVKKYIIDMRAREASAETEDDVWLEGNGIDSKVE